jgi:hypothetical protein
MKRKSDIKEIKDKGKYKILLSKYVENLERLTNEYPITNNTAFAKLVNFKKNKEEPIHRWFNYKQGYSSFLIEKILDIEKPKKKYYLLDPFTGVGTTNLAGQKKGYRTIGLDINPVASFAAKVKTNIYTDKDIMEIERLIENFKPILSYEIPDSQLLERSFSKRSFNHLIKIKGFFESIQNEKISSFFKLAYLAIIEDCSNRIKDGNGIKIARNKIEILDIYEYYLSKVKIMLSDLLIKQYKSKSIIINGSLLEDNNFKEIKNKKVGIVIFSPPYANCFDYCEVYKLELWMGGFVKNYLDFRKYRDIAIRSHVNYKFDHTIRNENKTVNIISDLISCFNIWNRNITDMIRGYFDDMYEILLRIREILVGGSSCFIVVANSGYRGILVPTDLLILEIAEKLGFRVDEIIYARKIRASSQQMKELHGEYQYLMRESIIKVVKE